MALLWRKESFGERHKRELVYDSRLRRRDQVLRLGAGRALTL
jgi:hypothetical protein